MSDKLYYAIMLNLILALVAAMFLHQVNVCSTSAETDVRYIKPGFDVILPPIPYPIPERQEKISEAITYVTEVRYVPYEIYIPVEVAPEVGENPEKEVPGDDTNDESKPPPKPKPPPAPSPPETVELNENKLYAYFYSAGELYPVECGDIPTIARDAHEMAFGFLFNGAPDGFTSLIPEGVAFQIPVVTYAGYEGIIVSKEIMELKDTPEAANALKQLEVTAYWTLSRFPTFNFSSFDILYWGDDGYRHSAYEDLGIEKPYQDT